MLLRRTHLDFQSVIDHRTYRGGHQLPLASLLRLLVLCFACGQRKLRDAEAQSKQLNKTMRRYLGVSKSGVSDSALYEMLRNQLPYGFRQTVQAQLREDLDRKAIKNDLFKGPHGGVLSIDGKGAGCHHGELPNPKCQHTFLGPNAKPGWRLFVHRAALVSSSARPILDQDPLPDLVGEATAFPVLFNRVVETFPRLFGYVTADAGNTSAKNAWAVRAKDKHYIFAVKANHRRLYDAACALLKDASVVAETTEQARGYSELRQLRRCWVSPRSIRYPDALQLWQVTRTRTPKHGEVLVGQRIYITSVPEDELSPEQILQLIRLHWGIESSSNWTIDAILSEDTHSPCYKGYGPLIISWLNILAYNLIAVFRAHSPRSEGFRKPWRQVLRAVAQVLTHGEVEPTTVG